MKRVNLFLCVATAAMVAFTSCNNDDDGPTISVEDGVYLYGTSVASEVIADDCKMQPGWIEKGFDSELRTGLYQDVLMISKTGNFIIEEVKGATRTKYGATLAVDPDKSWASSGNVVKDGAAITVADDGLYFVYLDLQATSKKIFVLKANEIGLIGDGVGSSGSNIPLTKKDAFSKANGEWEATNVTFQTGWWKIRKHDNWTYTIAENVNVLTNLGGTLSNPFPGGGNFPDVPRGKYTVNLKYEYGKGFALTTTKTGDVAMTNYSNCELELVGSGVDESNPNAIPDVAWGGWGHVLSAGKPTVAGTVYTWTWNSVTLKAEGFKIRTINAEASGGVNSFDLGYGVVDAAASPGIVEDGGNIKASVAGNYKIVLTINADTDARRIVITKL